MSTVYAHANMTDGTGNYFTAVGGSTAATPVAGDTIDAAGFNIALGGEIIGTNNDFTLTNGTFVLTNNTIRGFLSLTNTASLTVANTYTPVLYGALKTGDHVGPFPVTRTSNNTTHIGPYPVAVFNP